MLWAALPGTTWIYALLAAVSFTRSARWARYNWSSICMSRAKKKKKTKTKNRKVLSAAPYPRRELETAEDPAALRAAKVAEFREKFANPFVAASRGFVDEVIHPRTTRRRIIEALSRLSTKRDRNPPKKHGNIPL